MAGLIIENLCKTFQIEDRSIKALNDFNLAVDDESFITIVGKSGCGKTTLLRILCGLEEASGGTIKFTNCSDDDRKVSIVFQEPRLMPWLTVEENMAFPLSDIKDRHLVHEMVSKYLKVLGLDKFRKAYPSQISGGMAQRTSLGRTLCYDPRIILMDEPLGALDVYNRRKLQNELIDIFQSFRKTIVFVTHDVEEAIYLGQKVIVMDAGSIIDEIPVTMDYYRDTDSTGFLSLKKQILNKLY